MSDNDQRSHRDIRSPCVHVCSLDERDICIGCHRTGEEISRWGRMTDEEKKKVLKKVAEREKSSII